jgi:hypothetical protein
VAPDDPCASSDFREYTCLLIRNLAMQRGNKGRLVAMGNKNLSSASVLRFLLCALQPPPANSLRVCAAASAALWAILFHCERAKPALKALVGGVGGVGGGGGIGGKGGGVVAMNPVASALRQLDEADGGAGTHSGGGGFYGVEMVRSGQADPVEGALPSAERAKHHLAKLMQLLPQ